MTRRQARDCDTHSTRNTSRPFLLPCPRRTRDAVIDEIRRVAMREPRVYRRKMIRRWKKCLRSRTWFYVSISTCAVIHSNHSWEGDGTRSNRKWWSGATTIIRRKKLSALTWNFHSLMWTIGSERELNSSRAVFDDDIHIRTMKGRIRPGIRRDAKKSWKWRRIRYTRVFTYPAAFEKGSGTLHVGNGAPPAPSAIMTRSHVRFVAWERQAIHPIESIETNK